MDASDKLTLSSEIGALSAKMKTDAELEEVKAKPQAEYDSLMAEIQEGYNQAATTAQTARDAAIAVANKEITDARNTYQTRMAELAEKKREGEEAAASYYKECVSQANAIINEQNGYRVRYAAAKERLAQIEKQEEEERRAAEEAAKVAAEEAARKARAQEQARLAAASAAGATISTRKPHIRF